MKFYLVAIMVFLNISSASSYEARPDGWFFEIPPLEESFLNYGAAKESELSPDSFKVLVWNIYKGDKEGFDESIQTLAPDYDLQLIQEAVSDKMDVFEAISGFEYHFGVSFSYTRDPERFTGSMIGSKVAPETSWMARTKDLEPIIGTPKALTMGTFPFAGSAEKLLVINIHGLNVTGHAAYERHLDLAIEQMKNHDGPIIFGGDFNTRTKKRLEVTKARLEALGFSEMSFRNDERMRGAFGGHILDHVYTLGLEIIDSEVLGSLQTSDHKAMVFEARVPGTD